MKPEKAILACSARAVTVLLVAAAMMAGAVAQNEKRESARSDMTRPGLMLNKQDDELRYHFLPVGTGMCQIVECPGSGSPNPIVADCGSTGGMGDNDWNIMGVMNYAAPLLAGRKAIVTISHADSDHHSYLPDLFPLPANVDSIWIGGNRSNYPLRTRTWLTNMENGGVTIHSGFAPDYSNNGRSVPELACGTADTFILTVNSGSTRNDKSLMLSIDHEECRVILPGDATGKSQNAAISNYPGTKLYSTAVVGSHHGADTAGSNDMTWANATRPEIAIFNSGLKHYHPRCNSVNNYQAAGHIRNAVQHPLVCGYSGGWSSIKTTKLAMYATEDDGLVTLTCDSDLSVLDVRCDGHACL